MSRRSSLLAVRAALLAALASAPFGAPGASPFGPSPAGRALDLIADDAATAEALAPVVLEAATRRWTYRLFPRLLDVLEEWVREDAAARRPVVVEAFGKASAEVRTEEAARLLSGAADELKRRLAGRPEPKAVKSGWYRPREGEGVPQPWAAPGVSAAELRERRIGFVDAALPRESRTAYVRAAFEAFLAQSCGEFLGGRSTETCAGVGLEPLRLAALEAGLAGLSGDGTEPGLAAAYRGVDPAFSTRVLDEAEYRFPQYRCEACGLLRAWIVREPTRWQVRAALEPPLGP